MMPSVGHPAPPVVTSTTACRGDLHLGRLHALHRRPCMAVCPADCFYHTDDGIVLHNKDLCIGCGYCLFACRWGAPVPDRRLRRSGQDGQVHLLRRWPGRGSQRGGAPSTVPTALPRASCPCVPSSVPQGAAGGDAQVISDIFRERVAYRGAKEAGWGSGEELFYDASKAGKGGRHETWLMALFAALLLVSTASFADAERGGRLCRRRLLAGGEGRAGGVTTSRSPEHRVLISVPGQLWFEVKTKWVSPLGAIAIFGSLAMCGLMYWAVGPTKLSNRAPGASSSAGAGWIGRCTGPRRACS